MAELSYDDVRRAAQDAMRDLQNVVYGLQNSHNDLKRTVQQGSNSQYQLSDILTRISAIQQQVNVISQSLKTTSSGNLQPNQIHYSIQQSVNDLHRRLNTVEQFIAVCYRYFEEIQKQDNDDQEFKSV
jgi:DNA repair ATPase RecN